jgi:hypothetical protein
MVFADHTKCSVYIEEIVGGHLEAIKDDSLHAALINFCHEHNFLEVTIPLPRKLP